MEAGKIGGGNAYGYRVVHQLDARGEPIRGEREIIEEQAEVVRCIFREYVAGKGPQRIAADLNRNGIPSPTGKRWNDSTIRGNRIVSSGIVNCELYVGVIRWNRQKKLKNPDTGRSAYRINPESEWIRSEAPKLRIISQELWDAAKARQDKLAALYKGQIEGSRERTKRMRIKNGNLNAAHRPRTLSAPIPFNDAGGEGVHITEFDIGVGFATPIPFSCAGVRAYGDCRRASVRTQPALSTLCYCRQIDHF